MDQAVEVKCFHFGYFLKIVPIQLKVGSEIKGADEDSIVFYFTGVFKLPSAEMVKAVNRAGFKELMSKCLVLDLLNLK